MYRILMAYFKHETNNFNDKLTTIEDYKKRAFYDGETMMKNYRGSKAELGAYMDIFEARPDVEIVPAFCADANPGGYVTKETFEYFKDQLIDAYKKGAAEGGIDGIALVLHGAMITDFSEDGEGVLLKALRDVTGPDLPIVATLDYHANMTDEMAKYATALIPARYYPHTDFYDRGLESAQMLLDVPDGKAHPTTALKKLPLILPHMDTSEEPLCSMIKTFIDESEKPGVLYAYFVGGLSRANISVQGSAVYVITENDPALAEKIADEHYRW
ncbi:MAG: M81 family metallopeptidase, partial [Lachnospiraceae bacterium]|nr:M81 family metallopeptidase [Candidatus Hippenecus merdae]